MHARAAALLTLVGVLAVPGAVAQGYRIPPDNPFVNTPGARGEVFVYGLRNPWRWSFDHRTGAMLIADVGGNRREEITYLPRASIAGANLGWNCYEGTFVQRGCNPLNYFPPAFQYRSSPDVVIGGHVVRDPALPSFAGRYLFGRYRSGIYTLGRRASGRAARTRARVKSLTSLGEDGLGRLYATSYDGPLYRLRERGGSLALTRLGEFARPVGVTAPPGDPERLFVVEKRGRVKLRQGARVTNFLDISGRVRDEGYEQGLLALAFAPDYAASGRVFAYYTDNAGNLQLDEYARSAADPERADASTRRPLLTIPHRRSDSHNGGQLLFGPDRYLYVSTGDGDLKGDPDRDSQRLGSLLGKILRLDVGAGAAGTVDTRSPALRARVKRRQRVLRLGGAVAYVRCTESCSVVAGGRLRLAGRSYRVRRATSLAGPGRPVRVRVGLSAGARGALGRAVRGAASLRLRLHARDGSGNRSPYVVRGVRVRR